MEDENELCSLFSDCNTRTPEDQYNHLVYLYNCCCNCQNEEILLSNLYDVITLYLRNINLDNYYEIKRDLIVIKSGLELDNKPEIFKKNLIDMSKKVFSKIIELIKN